MLSFSGSLRIFIALDPCDMRAGINTLYALVGERLKEDAKSGALFVFTNKRRRLLKVFYWDGTGCWLLTNSHAPQCAFWFIFQNSLSISSALRQRLRNLRLRWR
jgi:transposase